MSCQPNLGTFNWGVDRPGFFSKRDGATGAVARQPSRAAAGEADAAAADPSTSPRDIVNAS